MLLAIDCSAGQMPKEGQKHLSIGRPDDPVLRDGYRMIAAINADDFRTVERILDVGYVTPDGFEDRQKRWVSFLVIAIQRLSTRSLSVLLDRGAEEGLHHTRDCGDDRIVNNPEMLFLTYLGDNGHWEKRLELLEILVKYKHIDLSVQKYWTNPACTFKRPIGHIRPLGGRRYLGQAALKYFDRLRELGLDINQTDSNGWSIVHLHASGSASSSDHDTHRILINGLQYFKRWGFDFNSRTQNGDLGVADVIRLVRSGKNDGWCGYIRRKEAEAIAVEKALISYGAQPRMSLPGWCPANKPYCVPC